MGRMSDLDIGLREAEPFQPNEQEEQAAGIHSTLISVVAEIDDAPHDWLDEPALVAAADVLNRKLLEKRNARNKD